jgi:preprotein translocase subunit SecA
MLMGRLRLPEDTPIQNRIVSKSLESAQKKVEGNNFDIRKHLVEYDDVINKHRGIIYKRRREVLEIYQKNETEKLTKRILEMVKDEITSAVNFHTADINIKDWNIKEIFETVKTIFKVQSSLFEELEKLKENKNSLKLEEVREKINKKLCTLAEDNYAEVKKSFSELGINFFDVEKGILIKSIDNLWIEHLETIDSLRQGVGLNSYGQRDPLVEYKKESFRLFKELEDLIQKQVVYSIYKTITALEERSQQLFSSPSLIDRAKKFSAPAKFSKDSDSNEIASVSRKPKDGEGKKIGRNDPCPCGSGKKYKKCCGK